MQNRHDMKKITDKNLTSKSTKDTRIAETRDRYNAYRRNTANLTCMNGEHLTWTATIYRVAQKSKPLPNDQKNVLNRIKTCEW